MYLTKEEEAMLNGEHGLGVQKAMRILATLGDIFGAEKMIPVDMVQVSGISYKSIGDAGLEFLEGFANEGVKVKTITTMNPAGMDMEDWKKMKVPKTFAMKQQAIINALTKMDVINMPTCAPYEIGFLPHFRQHIAWAESSAVCFANSVIGARTNREGGPSALAAAICGKTPYYGLHLEENRRPTIGFEVKTELKTKNDFALLGYHIGKVAKKGIPYIRGIKQATTDELKLLGAAMAASGGIALFHVERHTPEAELTEMRTVKFEMEKVMKEDLDNTKENLTTEKNPCLMCFGCPHASLREVFEYYKYFKKKKPKKPFWIGTSKPVKYFCEKMGIKKEIEKLGGMIIADTCMVVAPVKEMGIDSLGTDSAKGAHYTLNLSRIKAKIGDLEELSE